MTWSKLVLGIAVLIFLSGPLMTSIQQISDAIGVPSFLISFVKARTAILAIFLASQKSTRTASSTFSELSLRLEMVKN